MTIELILEEPSAEAAMRLIMPKILAGRAEVNYINMRNKSRLLQELPARLRGYKEQIRSGADIRIVVLIDRDSDDCEALKSRLEQMAYEAGLATRSRPLENGHYPKIDAAKSIARHMDVSRNASRSFQQFVKGVKVLAQG
ncbi:DUF4276 family protein [Prosthecochloris sp. HL-130-GSB]|jgi:hypothetical protein|uniref:DUF4276 family protein n=1 Tax=Prosthecochloris sp. HL-130-GSB TaxID=1974213 RepID=UPI001E433965|nr:DUF4276 family protein [Prosthecochloris sp. HL-130-GSB]